MTNLKWNPRKSKNIKWSYIIRDELLLQKFALIKSEYKSNYLDVRIVKELWESCWLVSIVADLTNGINVGVVLQSIVNVVYNILYDSRCYKGGLWVLHLKLWIFELLDIE